MASRPSGRIIRNIRICKEKVIISFKNGDKLDVSKDTFSSFYLFVGKEVSDAEYKKIKELNDITSLLNIALGVLKRSVVTEYKMRQKLYKKGAYKKDVDEVIKWLKQHDLINDDAYIEDFLEYASEVNMGQNKIKEKLYEKGISKERIEKIRFSETKERQKAKNLLPKINKKYIDLVGDNKKQHVYNFYVSHGFSSKIASEMVSLLPNDEKRTIKKSLEKDFEIVYKRFSRQYEERELFDHIFKSLKAKGYSYQDIRKKWEEKMNDIY